MGIENKHCTSDYWAEDKSAWFDRSLLPASHPPSLHSALFPPPPVLLPASPSPLLNILPVLSLPPLRHLSPSLPPFLPSISPSPLLNTHPSHSPSLSGRLSRLLLICITPVSFPLFYFIRGASTYSGLKPWESIDLGREEVEQGHLAQLKGDHWVSAEGLDTELIFPPFLSFSPILSCPFSSLFNKRINEPKLWIKVEHLANQNAPPCWFKCSFLALLRYILLACGMPKYCHYDNQTTESN